MTVLHTRAADRDARRTRRGLLRVGASDMSLAIVSAVAILLFAAAYAGRTRSTASGGYQSTTPVDLNRVADAGALEPVFASIMSSAADRRLAARELFAYLVQADGRRVLPNVGAIAKLDVRASLIDADSRLQTYRDRLRSARARAASSGLDPPQAISLLASGDLAAVKPLLVVRSYAVFRRALLAWGALYLIAFHAASIVWRLRGIRGDRLLLAAAHLLTAVGFAAMLTRGDPLRDTMLFVRFAQGVIGGVVIMTAVSMVNFRTSAIRELSYLPLAGALCLSVLLILFGGAPAGSNAKVNLGPFQPIEAIRLLVALFLAAYFARRWELLRDVRSDAVRGRSIPAWLNVPRPLYVLPVAVGVAAALALFFIQKDLGPALIVAVLFLALYAIARGAIVMALGGVGCLAAGFYIGYRLHVSATLTERVRMWQSPWDNTARGGDQIAHAIWSLATGARFGTGLGLGDTRYLPAGHTDLILAALGEELGVAGLLAIAVVFAAVVWRALTIARRTATDYGFFLALAIALLLAVPVLLMAAGTLGIVPLTGVVTPFLSYGGSAMVANFAALGILAALNSDPAPPADLEPFRVPVWCLGAVLALAGAALAVAVTRVQAFRADELVIRPHLGIQADGSRRYQYNPRVVDVARGIPRGTLFDRRGLPVATDDAALIRRARPDYKRLGTDIDAMCPDQRERCYALGGRAFHLLGDARTRTNWSASNTSYVERDAEAMLRGFDDHETSVRTTNASGAEEWTLRRDYRELVPFFRHRYDRDDAAVRSLLARRRDVQLTIDAALQLRTAAIVADYARRAGSGRAAAVVLDPDTGDLLASVSYPWPADVPAAPSAPPQSAPDELLDRARYGLYPPGSTFKLITAAAALGQDLASSRATFTCSRLPDGRVGARIAGWGRPVRDDVLDRHPHGKLDMHAAFVASCNAYFAQLAVRVGPGALLDTARRVDVPLARSNSAARVRDALPQVGYGQGEVVATPLRMARVASAIAAGGIVRDVRWQQSARPAATQVFVTPDAARLLRGYMRDVVLAGTGRVLRNHPAALAGKTGTAELAGAPSHSWFVGFAPARPATRRIALAVLIENAGYGSVAAAPAAGDIASAAAALGLIR